MSEEEERVSIHLFFLPSGLLSFLSVEMEKYQTTLETTTIRWFLESLH